MTLTNPTKDKYLSLKSDICLKSVQ